MPKRKIRIEVRGPRPPIAVQIDRTGTCAYVRIATQAVHETKELEAGLLADYDAEGHLVGFEIVGGLTKGRFVQVVAQIRSKFGDEAAALDSLAALTA